MTEHYAHTLSKSERLSGRSDIARLMSRGRWGACSLCEGEGVDGSTVDAGAMDGCEPKSGHDAGSKGKGMIKYCYLSDNGEAVDRIMVSVPKRLFKRAVKRNLLKRRIRESYRTQKELLSGALKAEDARTAEAHTTAVESRKHFDILFQYNTSEILSSAQIRSIIGTILRMVSEN